MRSDNRYSLWKVPTVGSVWWFPSINSSTLGWSSLWNIEPEIDG